MPVPQLSLGAWHNTASLKTEHSGPFRMLQFSDIRTPYLVLIKHWQLIYICLLFFMYQNVLWWLSPNSLETTINIHIVYSSCLSQVESGCFSHVIYPIKKRRQYMEYRSGKNFKAQFESMLDETVDIQHSLKSRRTKQCVSAEDLLTLGHFQSLCERTTSSRAFS